MKDGEVTKISYEGEVYLKTDEARKYDIIQITSDSYADTDKGGFYKVADAYGDNVDFRDNIGTTQSRINGHRGTFDIFRKSYVNSPTHEDRISALETRVGALEKVGVGIKTVQAGDIIRITDGLGNRNGEEMTVASVSSSGDVIRVEETDERLNIGEIDFEIIGRKEKPKFAGGDYVKVSGETFYEGVTVGLYANIVDLNPYGAGQHKLELIDRSDFDVAPPNSLEKVELTDGDLSFIRAGREPGEIEKGDIVKGSDGYTNRMFFGETKYENVDIIGARDHDGRYYATYKKDVILVAPASARVDTYA